MPEDERSPLVREALHWFAILRDEDVTDEERDAFEAWKATSPEHDAAWRRAQALWEAFTPVEDELARVRGGKLRRRGFLGATAGLFLAGAGGYTLFRNGVFADFSTGAGERRRLELADGSVVELNSSSSLSVDYSIARRRLVMHRGEAYFIVAPDPSRPFVVVAGAGETRALGTRFNIDIENGAVTVSVAEHGVEVSLPGRTGRIEAGWQTVYGPDRLAPPVAIDMAGIEAWRNGRLVYNGAPLRRVLHDMERHRGGFVMLLDESLGDLPVSAAFDIASMDAALDTMAQMLPIRIARAGRLIFVYKR